MDPLIQLLTEINSESPLINGDELSIKCPFHNDNDPSLHISREGYYHCFGCGAKGTLTSFISKIWMCPESKADQALMGKTSLKITPWSTVQQWMMNLDNHPNVKEFLVAHEDTSMGQGKMLTEETLQTYHIGYNTHTKRITLPIVNAYGHVVQVRQYNKQQAKAKMINTSGQLTLFPYIPAEPEVYITEGEWDCLMLRQIGLPAYCGTGGASSWLSYWNDYFQGKKVIIIYDNDEPGRKGAKAAALKLISVADVWLLNMPIKEGMDLSDWFFAGGTKEQFLEWVPEKYQIDTRVNLEVDYDRSLRDLIMSFHMEIGRKGSVYKATPRIPMHEVADEVVAWFKHHGATFFWEVTENQGYILFKGQAYPLDHRNSGFKAMMYEEGGIVMNMGEGSMIVSALQSTANRGAPKINSYPWIASDPTDPWKIYWNLHNGDVCLIAPNETKIVTVEDVPILQKTSKEWFKPFDVDFGVNKSDGFDLLKKCCTDHWMMDPTFKEILICWMLTMPLSSFSSVHPGVRIYGEAATGKSTILQLLHTLIYGSFTGELPTFTTAALWRKASSEPFILIDNQNVENLAEDLRTLFDLSATEGQRIMAAPNDSHETITQSVKSLIAVTGLDSFMTEDVLTRYLEIPTDVKFTGKFFAGVDKPALLRARPAIFSSLVKLISEDVLPYMLNKDGRAAVDEFRVQLHSKSRISEYLSLMYIVAEQISKYSNLINSKDIKERWIKAITGEASKTFISHSLTREWWNIMKQLLLGYETDVLISKVVKAHDSVNKFYCHATVHTNPELRLTLIARDTKGTDIIGIRGLPADLLIALRWAASMTREKLPWSTARALGNAYKNEKWAWKDDYNLAQVGVNHEIYWGDPIRWRPKCLF